MKPRRPPPTKGLVAVVWHDLFSLFLSWLFYRRHTRKTLLHPAEWVIYRCPTGGLLVSFCCNQFGGHCWDLVDERDLPKDFVRLVGGKYELVHSLHDHPVVEGVEQTPLQDTVTVDGWDSCIGTPSDGHSDTHTLGIVGDDPSLNGQVKGVNRFHEIILENISMVDGNGEKVQILIAGTFEGYDAVKVKFFC